MVHKAILKLLENLIGIGWLYFTSTNKATHIALRKGVLRITVSLDVKSTNTAIKAYQKIN